MDALTKPVIVDNVLFGLDDQVAAWVARRLDEPFTVEPGSRALGVIKGRDLVAGVVYDNWNGSNVHCSIATEGPHSQWASRGALAHIFGYPFIQEKHSRMTVLVRASNKASQRLVWQLGFEPEATHVRAAFDGGDLMSWRMFREDCRWIGEYHGQEERA